MLFVSTGDHIIPDELIIPKCFSRRYQTSERGRFSSDLEFTASYMMNRELEEMRLKTCRPTALRE